MLHQFFAPTFDDLFTCISAIFSCNFLVKFHITKFMSSKNDLLLYYLCMHACSHIGNHFWGVQRSWSAVRSCLNQFLCVLCDRPACWNMSSPANRPGCVGHVDRSSIWYWFPGKLSFTVVYNILGLCIEFVLNQCRLAFSWSYCLI